MVQTRDKKSHLELPPDFVVSTNLHVTHDSGKQVSRGGPMTHSVTNDKLILLLSL